MEESKNENLILLDNLLNKLSKDDLKTYALQKAEENKDLKKQLLIATDTVKNQEVAVDFYKAVASIDKLIEMSEVAKILNFKKMGSVKIFKFLRRKNILRTGYYHNQPYQTFVDRGYFKIIVQEFTDGYGETRINKKTMITQKGLNFIRKTLTEAGNDYNER